MKKMENKNDLTFEQAVARIDEIVTSLEKGDAELEKSLSLFKEGVKLIETCGTMLDKAEQIVVRLQTAINNEQPKEYLFDDE
jgi:exodeoxyribonuclease VII small subunit